MKLIDILNGPWAITPVMLQEIQSIYATHLRGEKIDIPAIEARLGKPLANEPKPYDVHNGVAVIPIDGVIAKRMNLFMQISGGTSTDLLKRDFNAAMNDPQIKAIILAVDSPGGTVDGTGELADAVYAARGTKPVAAWTDGMMASAAYWIGSAADQVYISGDTQLVGSIGVVASHVDISRREEMLGVKTTEITAGKYKRVASQYRPLSEEGRADIQDKVDYLYGVFVDAVARHRGVTAEQVLVNMADGRVFTGRQAITAGLVDGVSTLEALIEKLGGSTPAKTRNRTAEAGVAKAQTKEKNMNLETLKAEHPDLVAAIIAEAQSGMAAAVAAARAEGAAAERERIKAVEDTLVPGHEALISALKYDGKTTAPEAALQILGAEKQIRAGALKTMISEAPSVVTVVDAAEASAAGKVPADAPVEVRAKAEWDNDAKLRAEFGNNYATYEAYKRATESGRARIMKK